MPLIPLPAAVIGPFIFCAWWFRRRGRYWARAGGGISAIGLSKSFYGCDLHTALQRGLRRDALLEYDRFPVVNLPADNSTCKESPP